MPDSTCKWPECDSENVKAKGLCARDYMRARRAGTFDEPWAVMAERAKPKPCRWPECDRTGGSRSGFCERCGDRARSVGNIDSPWLTWRPYGVPDARPDCRWVGCDRPSEYAGFCSRDYSRARSLGNHVDPWNDWITDGKCEVCGKTWSGARNRNKRVCSKSCHVKAWQLENPDRARATKMDAVRRRRARMAGVTVEYFSIEDVRLSRGDDCYLCGEPIKYRLRFPHPKSPSLDHVVPISAGGAHSLTNAAMAHLECNIRKSDRATDLVPAETLFSQ